MMPRESFEIERFVKAQERVYPRVLEELRHERKRSHWMWFVFPQLKGLGRSSTAVFYGIGSLAEAQAYLAHPVLGPRLEASAAAALAAEARSLNALFGAPDDLKF